MATKIDEPQNVVQRNAHLVGQLMRYLIEKPELFDALPDDFELVILPEDDPELQQFNLQIFDTHSSDGKTVVFASIKVNQLVLDDKEALKLRLAESIED